MREHESGERMGGDRRRVGGEWEEEIEGEWEERMGGGGRRRVGGGTRSHTECTILAVFYLGIMSFRKTLEHRSLHHQPEPHKEKTTV